MQSPASPVVVANGTTKALEIMEQIGRKHSQSAAFLVEWSPGTGVTFAENYRLCRARRFVEDPW